MLDARELWATDPEAPITSVYEVIGPAMASFTVRMYGKTIGTLTCPKQHASQLLAWLLPGGHRCPG
jgi:hypothetical protein